MSAPGILIYTGTELSSPSFDELREVIVQCVGVNSYTIYHLKGEQLQSSSWKQNCQLVVIAAEQLSDQVDTALTEYFNSGGKILSFCSNFDQKFCTWELNNGSTEVVELECKEKTMHLLQGKYHYVGTESLLTDLQVDVLIKNTAGRAVAFEESNTKNGKCICTQVHLERGAAQVTMEDQDTLTKITESESLRQNMLDDLLARVGIQRDDHSTDNQVTVCEILSAKGQSLMDQFIDMVYLCHADKIQDNILTIPDVGDFSLSGTDKPLQAFQWMVYKESLTSREIGNILLYQRISYTTQNTVDPFMSCCPPECGVVAIASRQLKGRGRGNNKWLTPLGSLPMTMHIRVDANSSLGEAIYYALKDVIPAVPESGTSQPAVSVANTLTNLPAVAVARLVDFYLQQHVKENLDYKKIVVKWPNDIYYNGSKIGGVLVDLKVEQHNQRMKIHAYTGIGVNVTNKKPTVNLNDVINDFNKANGTDVPYMSIEYVAARICSETQLLIDMFNHKTSDYLEEYHKYWMHSGAVVDVEIPGHEAKQALVLGVDKHGFLRLKKEDGTTFIIAPEGSSFDIINNIIKVKA